MAEGPGLRVVDADASAEEVAAIVAAVAAVWARPADGGSEDAVPGSHWVQAGRMTARGAELRRGDWRRSGRIGRRVGS